MLSHLIALGVLLKSPDFIVAQSLFPSDLKVNEVNVDGSTQAKNPRNYFKVRITDDEKVDWRFKKVSRRFKKLRFMLPMYKSWQKLYKLFDKKHYGSGIQTFHRSRNSLSIFITKNTQKPNICNICNGMTKLLFLITFSPKSKEWEYP